MPLSKNKPAKLRRVEKKIKQTVLRRTSNSFEESPDVLPLHNIDYIYVPRIGMYQRFFSIPGDEVIKLHAINYVNNAWKY